MIRYIFCFVLLLPALTSGAQTYFVREGRLADTTTDAQLDYGSPLPYYYSVAGKYPKSSATLLQEVKVFMKKEGKEYTGSGYITFRFVVDVEGRRPQTVKVMQTDAHYKRYAFDQGLIRGLFAYFQTLDQWRIPKIEGKGAISYLAFLTFKIDNGQVVGIIP